MSVRDLSALALETERRASYARLSLIGPDPEESSEEVIDSRFASVQSIDDSEVEKAMLPTKSKSSYRVGTCYKMLILLLISFPLYIISPVLTTLIAFGSLFVYDSISALEGDITSELSLNKSLYGLFFSLYAIPNIVLVIGGGVLIDRIGSRKSALIFGSLIVLGSIIIAAAPTLKRNYDLNPYHVFIVMLAGRFTFGIGAESVYVVQNSVCVEWFHGKHMSKAMGLINAVAHMGSVFAFNIQPVVADTMGDYVYALWFASFLAVTSFFCIVGFILVDIKAKRKNHIKREAHRKITLNDVRHFSRRYWIGAFIAICIECSVSAFRAMSSDYIQQKWQMTDDKANFFVSMVDITALVGSPLCGLLVDWTGFNGWLIVVGTLSGVTGFALLGLTHVHPIAASLCIGVQYSFMNAAVYPSVALLIADNFEGTAYSLISALLNMSVAGILPLSGWIADNYGFTWLCLFFAGLSSIASLLSIVWNLLDVVNAEPVLNKKRK